MQRYATLAALTALIFAAATLTASAQIPLNMSYQARLADNQGNPVPDSSYDMEFRFYTDSTGGAPVWTESFFDVLTNNGFFDVFLEMDLDNLDGPLFMEVMVEDEIMSPRARMASVPFSAISQRVQGDIQTGEGFIRMSIPPDPVHPVAEIMSDENTNITSLKMSIPLDPVTPVIEMSAGPVQSSFKLMDPVDKREGFVALVSSSGNSMKLMNPDDDSTSAIEMSADPVQSSFKLIDPVDKREGFVALTNVSGSSIKLMDPADDIVPLVELSANNTESSLKLIDPGDDEIGFDVFIGTAGNSIKLMDPGDDGVPVGVLQSDGFETSFKLIDPGDDEIGFEVLTNVSGSSIKLMDPADEGGIVEISAIGTGPSTGASFKMFNPQPEPPAVVMEMSTAPSTGASFKMFNPQPEPPADPLLEMNTTQYGASFAMAAPQAGYGPGDDITDPMFEVIADSTGGAINLSDEIGKYMGLDPSPFTPGGFLYMMDPSSDDTTISLGSNGYVSVDKGVTIGPNTNAGNHTFVMGEGTGAAGDNCFAGGRIAEADHDNCFVWSDYPVGPAVFPLQTSGVNQFLVRATGGIKFYTNATLTSGVELTPGATSWSSITTLDGVRNLRPVDGEEILNKIEQLPISRYGYKSEDESIEHIGPMAKDFHNLFGIGPDDEHISTLDPSGVALAGMKEMINIINELKDKNAELENRIAELERTR